MFRTVRLSIIRSLFTVQSAMVCVMQVCRQDRTAVPSRSCSKAVYKPVWHIPLLSVQWINCWWWTDELSETCRVSCQNKFVKLVHLVGFIINKYIGSLCKEAVTTYFNVLSTHLSEETKKNYDKPRYSWCTFRDPNREPPKQNLKSLLLET